MFKKVLYPDGKIKIFFLGHKIFSYKKQTMYDKIYSKRFQGLTDEEARLIIEMQFERQCGCKLDLDNPQSFNEKIQWLKLYYRDPLMTKCADKVGVREYVKEKIGEQYLVPLLGIYDNPDEIDFEKLPDKFVLKVNWGSGQNIICKNKSKLDILATKTQLQKWLKPESNHYFDFLEWCYKDIKPKIIAEEFIVENEPVEYQLFCFSGKVHFILCEINGKTDEKNWKRNIYDTNWNKAGFKIGNMATHDVKKPKNIKDLINISEKLAEKFPFVRIDIYNKDEQFKIREMTFYSGNGNSVFYPPEINFKLGNIIQLPQKKLLNLYVSETSLKYYKDYSSDIEIKRPLNVKEVNDGIILPAVEHNYKEDFIYYGGVIDRNHNFVKESQTRRHIEEKSLLDGYPLKTQPIYKDEIVIYGGILYEFYGHVVLETLSRLWYFIKHNPNHYRVIFNFVPRAKGKFQEFFELLDIPYDSDTFITKPTQYKKVIIPEQATIYATNWHRDWLIPFNYMASKVKASPYQKIYFTRTKLTERNPVWGECPIEKLFKKNGFKVFSPEKLSLKKQISLMKGCQELVTVQSSTYHNLLFGNNGTTMVSLNRAFKPDYSQHIVDKAKKLKAYYVDVSLNPLPVLPNDGPWIIGFTHELKQFCTDYRLKFSQKQKLNLVPHTYIFPFFYEWKRRYHNLVLDNEDVSFYQSRITYYYKKTLMSYILKLVSIFTFGKTRCRLKKMRKGLFVR